MLKARYSNQHRVAPLSSERGRSHSREGQLCSLRQTVQSVAVFSAQIHITVTMLSPNNVLLSKISAQVLKVSRLCPGRAGQRRPDDEKMTEYQGLTAHTARSDVHSMCSSRKVTQLSFHNTPQPPGRPGLAEQPCRTPLPGEVDL